MFTAKLSHRHAAFSLSQDRKDLGFTVSCHLHLNLLVYLAEKILLPQPLTFRGDYRMHCVKLLGQRLAARDFDRQVAKFQNRVAVMNGFTALGIPVTEPRA